MVKEMSHDRLLASFATKLDEKADTPKENKKKGFDYQNTIREAILGGMQSLQSTVQPMVLIQKGVVDGEVEVVGRGNQRRAGASLQRGVVRVLYLDEHRVWSKGPSAPAVNENVYVNLSVRVLRPIVSNVRQRKHDPC